MTLLVTCGDHGVESPGDTGGIPGIDTIPPAAVDGLVARNPTGYSITLVWFSPGDDGMSGKAAAYDIRWAKSPVTESTWDAATRVEGVPAPKPARQVETFVVKGLTPEENVYFALKTSDEAENESAISNWSMCRTRNIAPSPITDLEAVAISDGQFRLTWTATGDDEKNGTASFYDIRYHTGPIDASNWKMVTQAEGEPAPKGPGEPDTCIVGGLFSKTNYYFAVKIGDEAGNLSSLSNVRFGYAFELRLLAAPNRVQQGVGQEVQISYKASPDSDTRINIWGLVAGTPYYYDVRRHLLQATLSPDTFYVANWNLLDDYGRSMIPSFMSVTQCNVRLLWGETTVGEVGVTIYR